MSRLCDGLLWCLLLIAIPASAVELIKWERIPLPIALHVGQERIVFVDRNVRVGFPPSLNGKLRVQSSGGAVYLLAQGDFPRTRLSLQDVKNGELILLDISASAGKSMLEPVKLVYQGDVTSLSANTHAADLSTSHGANSVSSQTSTASTPIPVTLTRFAAQSLYAPQRTVEPLPGVHQIALSLPANITTLLPSESVHIRPVAAWGLAGYSVVALILRNLNSERIILDPRHLHGAFYSATFQHRWLGASGTPEDTTTLYLVIKGRPDNAFIPEPPLAAEKGKKEAR